MEQMRSLQQEPTLLTPWSWSCSLGNCETTHFRCLSHQVGGTPWWQPWQTNTFLDLL